MSIPSPCKALKLPARDREEVGWQNPFDWEYSDETLAKRNRKLKENRLHASPPVADLRKDVAASTPVAKAKRSSAITSTPTPSKGSKGCLLPSSKDSNSLASACAKLAATPTSATRRSARGKGQEAATIMEKAQRLAEEKDAAGTPSPLPLLLLFFLHLF